MKAFVTMTEEWRRQICEQTSARTRAIDLTPNKWEEIAKREGSNA